MSYHVGSLVQLTASFSNISPPALADPDTVTFTIQQPDGTVQAVTPSRASTGIYLYQLNVTEPGEWQWRVAGSGAVQAAGESAFVVVPPAF